MRGAVRTGACAIAAAALLAGCDGGGHKKASPTTTRTSSTTGGAIVHGIHVLAVVDIRETEYKLEPSTMGFERVGYFGLRAVNDGTVPHALAVSGPGVAVRTKAIEPHESATIAVYFRKPGVYRLYCPLADHRRRGMAGTVRVR